MENKDKNAIDLSKVKLVEDESGFHYELSDGTNTRNFYWATEFSNYFDQFFAIVQKEYSSPVQAMNIEGKLSDRGFPKTATLFRFIEEGGELTYGESVKKSGRVDKSPEVFSQNQTGAKERLAKYFGYEATIYDLTPEEILANLEKIQAFEEYNYYMALEHCDSNWDMMELLLNYQTLAQYIKQTAYDAKMKTKKNLTLDEWREELKEKPLF